MVAHRLVMPDGEITSLAIDHRHEQNSQRPVERAICADPGWTGKIPHDIRLSVSDRPSFCM